MSTVETRTVLRLIDELLWALRRDGFRISTAQGIDVVRAAHAIGLEPRDAMRDAIACIVVHDARERPRFDATFDRFFVPSDAKRTLWERLAAQGFDDLELAELRALLHQAAAMSADGARLDALATRGAELDRLLHLAGVSRSLDAMQSPLQAGFFTHRILSELGVARAQATLGVLRARLVDALGAMRGKALADAVARELERAAEEVREHVARVFARRQEALEDARRSRTAETTEFTSLSDAEVEEVRAAVRLFVERLRGGARVRVKRARRGRIDLRRTMRRALATGGIPFAPARKTRRHGKPRLILLCDVSESVRTAARFLLEFSYAAQELVQSTRSFVFVSELGEVTDLFAREPIQVALAQAYAGHVVSVADNSNYGRVLRDFEARYLRDVDRRTTVVILGDGRTNYHQDEAQVLDAIRNRARAVLWLCTEPRGAWAQGDSAMSRYATKVTEVLDVRCAKDLEIAARRIFAR